MDAMSVLENSYHLINKNFGFYKRNFGHIYYLSVQDDEIKFIDKLFGKVENKLSAQDKMLNYSISAIYTATAVLIELMNRNDIEYDDIQMEEICAGFSNMNLNEVSFEEKTEEELDEILFGLLTDGIDLESRKKSGSERTPDEIIKYMLNIIGYNEMVSADKSIVDPACGTGTFIKQIMDRFVDGLYINESTDAFKEKLLNDKLIRAYDTKPSNVFVTKIVMISVLVKRKLIKKMDDVLDLASNLPVYCQDFLRVEEKSDYVVGNPPYIRLQNMSVEHRDFVKKNYVSATGRFDIFTCFLEKSDKLLNEDGKMCLITSNKYLTANYGVGVREYLSQTGHVRKLVDLYDTKFFGAAVLPAIIMCENNKSDNCDVDYIGIKTAEQDAQYECLNASELFEFVENELDCGKKYIMYGNGDKRVFEVSRSKVKVPVNGSTWNFSTSDENTIKIKMDEKKLCSLGDIFDVCVGIKTTADAAYERQPLDYIFSVEILNEGVDIVEVNQVIMLRPTESPIVFIQQLGRGLRKAEGKEYVVILDFIGNYTNNFMIPVALSGDRTYNADTIRRYVISGNSTIPGASTIHFDEVAKDKIFRSIDKIRGIKSIIKESYISLKNRIGRVPYLLDFYENGEIDPLVIIREYKTYFSFLEAMEKGIYTNPFTEQEKRTLEYLSKTVLSGARPYELEILKAMLSDDTVAVKNMQEKFSAQYGYEFKLPFVENAVEVLQGHFVSKEEEYQKFCHIDILKYDEQKTLQRMESFAERLTHKEFYKQINDIISVGFCRYKDRYMKSQDCEIPFVLYEKYSRRDVSLLMNCGKDLSAIMFGMKRIEDDVFIFVTYHKEQADDEKNYVDGKPDYADAFEDNMIFRWDSQMGKGMNSSYMNDVTTAKRKHLFVKKSDAEANFYYMGQFDIIDMNEAQKENNKGKKEVITKVKMKMHHPVRDDLLRYLQAGITLEENVR